MQWVGHNIPSSRPSCKKLDCWAISYSAFNRTDLMSKAFSLSHKRDRWQGKKECKIISNEFLELIICNAKEKFQNSKVSQKFCVILVTYLLYSSSFNKNSQAFKIEAIMLYHLNSSFCLIPYWFQFFSFKTKNSFNEAFTSLGYWSIANAISESWIGTNDNLRGARSRIYAWVKPLFCHFLIPCWYQFLSFKAKNPFTEAFASS